MLAYCIIGGVERMCLPVLFKEISIDLNLSLVSIGTIWGLDPLAGVFIGVPGGLLADRFGLKNTLMVVCLLAGILSALRGFSTNFLTLALTVFVFGVTAAMVAGVAPKTTAVWFSRRYLGLTNGLVQGSWYLGSIIATMLSATVLSPLLGGWQNVLFILSAPAIILGILWLTTGREPEKSEMATASEKTVPLGQAFSRVMHMKEVWIIGGMQMVLFGASTGFMGYLALYLRNIGWSVVASDSALTTYNAAGMVGIIPMIMVSNRLGGKKRVLAISAVVTLVTLALIPFITNSWLLVLLAVSGFLRSAAGPICTTLIFENKGIGSTYGGTAVGLASSMGMLGSFAAPPLGNSLNIISPGAPFFFWAFLCAIVLPLLIFVKVRSPSEVEYST
jgi:MFS transporter, NNP family, nitrate/nitrite transporter